MPIIHLQTVGKPTKEQKAQIVREFTDTLVRVMGSNPEKTHIVIDEISPENWGNNNILIADRPAAPAK